MATNIPEAGQTEEAPALVEGVGVESLRDTRTGYPPEPRGGLMFTYQGGARPLDGYTIKRGVGRGGFGEVYYSLSDAGKEVALKLVRRNLEIELRGMTQCLNLKHPNLISLYDIRQDGHEAYWVVMEYVAGESLEQILARHPDGLPPGEAVACMKQVCAGVAYLHDRGIVHRDLKPGNIFLDEGTYKIGDYGLSKFISHSRRSGQTESIGTVHYMAPEIANGRYGKEIDTYALGIMFYEMLTGHVPYEGESIGEVLMKHLTAEPDLNRVPAPFRPIVARLLRKDPDHRYPTVPAMLEDIEAALAGRPLSTNDVSTKSSVGSAATPSPTPAAFKGFSPVAPAAGPRRLRASSKDQVLSGVCAGFANYFGVDPIWIRLALVLVTFLASGIPIILYFILAMIMPSDQEETETPLSPSPSSGVAIDPKLLRQLSLDALRVLISLFVAVGVGCVAGAVTFSMFGWRSNATVLIPLCFGFAAASVSVRLLTTSGHALFRGLCVLLFATAAGLGAASVGIVLRLLDYEAAFLGVGSGLLMAAIGFQAAFYQLPHVMWRMAASVFAGVGIGLLVAGGTLTLTSGDEMAAFLGIGAGFLAAGLTAYNLFFGLLSPARSRQRAVARAMMGATQAWETGEQQPSTAADGKRSRGTPRWLIVTFVLVGLIPAALFVLARMRASSGNYSEGGYFTGHSCSALGCTRPATVVFSRETATGTNYFNRYDYCETHARQSAWEAQGAGVKYGVFDILTGRQRTDYDDDAASHGGRPLPTP